MQDNTPPIGKPSSDLELMLRNYVAHSFLNNFFPQPGTSNNNFISPVPDSQTLSNPGMLDYVARNVRGEENASPDGSSGGQTVQYPSWMGNTPQPGQNDWVNMMVKKNPTLDIGTLNNLYNKAVTSKGFSGNYYNSPTPQPTPVFGQIEANNNPISNVMSNIGQTLGIMPKSSQWSDLVSAATHASKETGIPLQVILGQAYAETSGRPQNAPGNNWFGIKGSGNAGTQSQKTWENYGKGRQDVTANFAGYKSAGDAVNAYVNWVKSRPDVYGKRNDPTAMIQAVKARGYATDPNYVSNVMNTPAWKQYSSPQASASNKVPTPEASFLNKAIASKGLTINK